MPETMPMGGMLSAGLSVAGIALETAMPIGSKMPRTPADELADQPADRTKNPVKGGSSYETKIRERAEKLGKEYMVSHLGINPSMPEYERLKDKYAQQMYADAKKQVMQEDMTLQHQQMLRSMTNMVGTGAERDTIDKMIENYTAAGGGADRTAITGIMNVMANTTNFAYEYAGINKQVSGDYTALMSGLDYYSALKYTGNEYSSAIKSASKVAMENYGGVDLITSYELNAMKLQGTFAENAENYNDILSMAQSDGKLRFASMFEQNLQHTALNRSSICNEFDTSTPESQRLLEMYGYFSDLRGGYGSFNDALSKGYVIIGEEGMGGGKPVFNGIFNDRITIIRDGKLLELNYANLDPRNDKGLKSVLAPGVYDAIVGNHRDKPNYMAFLLFDGSSLPDNIKTKWQNGTATASEIQSARYAGLPALVSLSGDGRIYGANIHGDDTDYTGGEGCQTIMNGLINIGTARNPDYRPIDDGKTIRSYIKVWEMFGYKNRAGEWHYDYNAIGKYMLLSQITN